MWELLLFATLQTQAKGIWLEHQSTSQRCYFTQAAAAMRTCRSAYGWALCRERMMQRGCVPPNPQKKRPYHNQGCIVALEAIVCRAVCFKAAQAGPEKEGPNQTREPANKMHSCGFAPLDRLPQETRVSEHRPDFARPTLMLSQQRQIIWEADTGDQVRAHLHSLRSQQYRCQAKDPSWSLLASHWMTTPCKDCKV